MPAESVRIRTRRLVHRLGLKPYAPPRVGAPAPPPRPVGLDFVLIGAQKAGSTFLHQAIEHHPQLHMPEGEIPVFEDGVYSDGALDWLERLLERAPRGCLRGIKRPDCLGRPESAGLLARHAPDAKLVAVLREPVSRTLSAYYHYMRRGHLPTLHPDEGLPLLLEGALNREWPRAWEVLAFSRYGECLDRYREHFPWGQLCILIQDEVIEDPAAAVREVYRYLEVDPAFQPPGLGSRALPTVYSLPRVRFLAWAQSLRGETSLGTEGTRAGLPGRIAYLAAMGVDRLLLRPVLGNRRAGVSAEVIQRVKDALAPDRPRLIAHLGERIGRWSD